MMGSSSDKVVIVPSLVRPSILHGLHAAHRGPEFTIRFVHSCVPWSGISSQVTTLCNDCFVCVQYSHQSTREPLQPYHVPTLPWQLVSKDFFELNGVAYLVTVHQNRTLFLYNVISFSTNLQAAFWPSGNPTYLING